MISPSLYNDFSLKVLGNSLSIIIAMQTPKDRKIKHSKMLTKGTHLLFKKLILSGIRSNNDKKSITEDAKEIPPIRKFRVFFLEKRIINAPINVESPAIDDRVNDKNILFILSP